MTGYELIAALQNLSDESLRGELNICIVSGNTTDVFEVEASNLSVMNDGCKDFIKITLRVNE